MSSYFKDGVIGPQVSTADPPGGIGTPARPLYQRPLWDSPAIQGPPHNLPAPGDRLRPRGSNLIGGAGSGGGPTLNTPIPNGTQFVRERHRYANLIETPIGVDLVSITALSQPTGLRNMLLLRNASTTNQVIFISFGNTATIQSVLRLTANQQVLFDTVVPQNEVNAVADVAGAILVIAYSQYPPL